MRMPFFKANVRPNRRCRACLQYIPGQVVACSYCGHFQNKLRDLFRDYGFPFALALFAIFFPSQLAEQIQKSYNNQLIIGLKVELSQNFACINNAREILENNQKLLVENKINLTPLIDLRFEAWERTASGPGNFLEHLTKTDTAGFRKLDNCYTALRILQRNFENRESYRYLQEGRAQFVEHMQRLDKTLLSTLDKAQELIKIAQTYLYEIHDWKVAGESHSIDTFGRVVTESDLIQEHVDREGQRR